MGVYMAWEARHVKVQVLNDSQYIGICVYSAFSSAVIVVLSNFLPDYPTFSYLATTSSILTSTTITLFLLFLPKLKGVLGRVESDDPIMQSMGLKYEYNTRRFVTDDPKELTYRMEVQNKVYKCEIKALDEEIARLEELLAHPTSSGDIYTISSTKNQPIVLLTVPTQSAGRASWPSAHKITFPKKNSFGSDAKLNFQDHLSEKSKLKKLKELFGSIPAVWHSPSSNVDVSFIGEKKGVPRGSLSVEECCASSLKPQSDPEFLTHSLSPPEELLTIKSNSASTVVVPEFRSRKVVFTEEHRKTGY